MNNEELLLEIKNHLDGFPARQREIHDMRILLLGNPSTGEVGMKQKLDEIHNILTQSKGVIAFFGGVRGIIGFIVVFAAAVTVLKGWFK